MDMYSYLPPKNKYPQYTRRHFASMTYASQIPYLLMENPLDAHEIIDDMITPKRKRRET